MALCRRVIPIVVTLLTIGSFWGCATLFPVPVSVHGPDAIFFQSAKQQIEAMQVGRVTSSQLLDLYLERIKFYNGRVNAVVALDEEAARARAAEADRDRDRGRLWGPLHGLPMTVKDVYDVVGMANTSGSPEFKDHRPGQNAVAVQRLVDAGAIIFGKTNTPARGADYQTYNQLFGTTNNPWDLSRTPGGSSGGAAVALAVGFTPLELGSDVGGSLRVPASFTGVYGHKPTFGLVPRQGHVPPAPGRVPPHIMPTIPMFVTGPMARSAEDLALALEVLTTRPELAPAPEKKLAQYRVAVWFTDTSPESEIAMDVMPSLQKAVEALRAAGVQVDEAHPYLDLAQDRQLWLEIYQNMMAGNPPKPELQARQEAQYARWAEFFEHYDVLLAPVTRTTAIVHDASEPKDARSITVNGRKQPYWSNLSWDLMALVSGLPATAAPVGISWSGLPVGVQIIGDRYKDLTTIAFAGEMAKVVGGYKIPPGYEY